MNNSTHIIVNGNGKVRVIKSMITKIEVVNRNGNVESWYRVDRDYSKRGGYNWQSWSNGWQSKVLRYEKLQELQSRSDIERENLAYINICRGYYGENS